MPIELRIGMGQFRCRHLRHRVGPVVAPRIVRIATRDRYLQCWFVEIELAQPKLVNDVYVMVNPRTYLLLAGGAVIGAALGLASGYLFGRSVAVPGNTEFWKVAAQPIATVVVGIGAITAAFLTLWNGHLGRVLEAENHSEEAQRDREGKLRDRYVTVAAQLADDHPAIREAGVYATVALTHDWQRHGEMTEKNELALDEQQTCVNLLCSYLRANRIVSSLGDHLRSASEDPNTESAVVAPSPELRLATPSEIGAETAVRHTIVAVLRQHLKEWRERGISPIDLSNAYLQSANFAGADLRGARLGQTRLTGADFTGADLRGAQFNAASLEHTLIAHADLRGAFLVGVTGSRTIFASSQMSGAHIYKAELSNADLSCANLTSTSVAASDLTGADLSAADLTKAQFPNTRLAAANLASAILEGTDLREAILDENTRLPDSFSLKAFGCRIPSEAKRAPKST